MERRNGVLSESDSIAHKYLPNQFYVDVDIYAGCRVKKALVSFVLKGKGIRQKKQIWKQPRMP